MAIIPIFPQNKISFETPEKKKQKKMMLLLGIVVLTTVLVLYFGFGSSTDEAVQPVSSPGALSTGPGLATGQTVIDEQEMLVSLENIKLDFSIFDDKRFNNLKDYEAVLDISGEKGRSNPFLPY